MGRTARRLFAPIAIAVCIAAVAWSTWSRPLPPADLTVSNGTEIKSIDPAMVTGQPEGFVIRGLFEGLVDWDAKDLHVIPGVAESWDLSEDQTTYTFHIRDNAKWSNGEPVTAHDFTYTYRRFLDPMTGAEYTKLLGQIVNAHAYNSQAETIGSSVEVELDERVEGALPHARHRVVRGTLIDRREIVLVDADEDAEIEKESTHVYSVELAGETRRFCPQKEDASRIEGDSLNDVESCRQVLLDFSEVGIKALDERTLQIKLQNPTPYFLQLMGFYPFFPVNQTCVETHGYPAWTKPKNVVSNGPFVLQHRRVRDKIRMVRNPHFWDQENIHLDTVDILAVESQTTELNLYLKGKIEYFRQVPAPIIPEMLRQNRPDFQPVPYLSVYFYMLNTKLEGLRDVRVRKSLALAVNRRELVEKVTRAGQVPAQRYVPPGIADYEEAKRRLKIVEVERDYDECVREAQGLLAEAGYPDGQGLETLTLLFNSNDMHSQIAELLQAQWKDKLGINVKLVAKEWGSYLTDIRQQEFVIARRGWIGDYVDPNAFLELLETGVPQNNTGWSNERYDQLLHEAAAVKLTDAELGAVAKEVESASSNTGDDLANEIAEKQEYERRVKRMKILVEAEDIMLEELPVVPLFYYVTQGIQRPWIKGWNQNIQDVHPFRGVSIDKEMKARMIREGLQ